MSFLIKRSFLIPDIAVKFLEKTIKETPGCVDTIEEIVDAIDTNQLQLYLVKSRDEIYGAIVTTIVPNPHGKDIFNLSLLGGKRLREWRKELHQFIIDMPKETNTELCIVSRVGWKKIIPELKVIGYVYTL